MTSSACSSRTKPRPRFGLARSMRRKRFKPLRSAFGDISSGSRVVIDSHAKFRGAGKIFRPCRSQSPTSHDRKLLLSNIVRLTHGKRPHRFSLLRFAPRAHLKIVGPFA